MYSMSCGIVLCHCGPVSSHWHLCSWIIFCFLRNCVLKLSHWHLLSFFFFIELHELFCRLLFSLDRKIIHLFVNVCCGHLLIIRGERVHQLRGGHIPIEHYAIELHELFRRLLFNLDWTNDNLYLNMLHWKIF